jgi:hypothetical protein
MKKNLEINWKSKPEKEDYASAKEYLALLYDEKKADANNPVASFSTSR